MAKEYHPLQQEPMSFKALCELWEDGVKERLMRFRQFGKRYDIKLKKYVTWVGKNYEEREENRKTFLSKHFPDNQDHYFEIIDWFVSRNYLYRNYAGMVGIVDREKKLTTSNMIPMIINKDNTGK